MNEQESIAFLSDVAFVAFPSVRQWLLTTDRYNETVKMMAKGLSDIKREEADAVIEAWVTGNMTPPKYMRDTFVLEVRACALDRRKKIEDHARRTATAVPSRSQVSMRTIQTMRIWTEHWLPLAAQVRAGELSAKDALATWYAIVDAEWSKVMNRSGVT